MDNAFIYSKPVTGKNFIGRKPDMTILSNLLNQNENVVIYEPPCSGKTSLVQQTFYNMKVAGARFVTASLDMFNLRDTGVILCRLGDAVIRSSFSSPEEYSAAVASYLRGTHFVFDMEQFALRGSILSLNWDVDEADMQAVFALPYRIAADKGTKIYVVLKEFQNVMLAEDGEKFLSVLEEVFKEGDEQTRTFAGYIFMGSGVNAMHEIFGVRKFFWRQVERVRLTEIDPKDLIEHIVKGFLASGKVIDRDLLVGVCKLFRNNPWHIMHFAAVCDSLTRGYIMEPTLNEALSTMIATFAPKYQDMMNGLTNYQVSLLRAVVDGHTKFSSAEVIEKYGLNSSANVKRLREALCKKEIITFDENDSPVILDPLFEYWVSRYYFELKGE